MTVAIAAQEAADALDARETLIENLLVASESAHAAITALKDDLRKSAERIKALEGALRDAKTILDAMYAVNPNVVVDWVKDKARALLGEK